ncbi:MAG: selenocysteine synthase, partial [Luteitalea sp.]
MWSRRDFLETLSGVPLIGGLVGTAAVAGTAPVQAASRDYFGDLGIKPFINAAGTYTDMTASLMPEEVRAAWEYAAQHFVPLNDLHDRIGERIATLVKAEAAMVTSGAAAAMTLGTAGVLTGTGRQKVVHLPNLVDMKTEVIIQKAHRFGYDHAVRNCGVRLIEVETADELERAVTW